MVPEPFKFRTTINNLRLDQELGFATLTATATRHLKRSPASQDSPGSCQIARAREFPRGRQQAGHHFEVRLASRPGSRFEYLVGAYHDSTREWIVDTLDAPAAAPMFGTRQLIEAPVEISGRERGAVRRGT